MVTFSPKFYLTLGKTGQDTVYVKNSSGDWIEFDSYEYFKVNKRQNQVYEFELKLVDIQSAEKAIVKEFAEVLFLSENNLILKGRIQKITYETSYDALATGFGMEAKVLDKELSENSNTSATWQDAKRGQWTNISAQTIAKELLSSNTNGASPWIMNPNTTGLFDTDYGNVSMRYEYANRLNALAKLTESIDHEWWVSQGNDYNDDYFNIAPLQPDGTKATVSQETFTITGANSNCYLTNKEKDINNVSNKVDILGRGDGINQLHTSCYNASSTYSTLASDITSSSTTITLLDASSFPSSGTIRIMEEIITYSGKSGNNLTGCTRPTDGTAYAHKKNVYIEKHITIASAESGSSIGDNGLLDLTIINRDIIELETLELVASRKLLDKKDPIVRIKVIPDEPLEVVGNREIGELITITDAESDISDDYRIVGITYISDYGSLEMEIEASNKSLSFIEQMQKQREEQANMSKYMQGSTNIYSIQSYENCDDSYPLNLKFYIPDDVVAINSVKISFDLEDYRAYTATTPSGGGTTTAAGDVGSYLNFGMSIATPGYTYTDPYYEAVIPSQAVGTYVGATISGVLLNRESATEDFPVTITNETDTVTYYSDTWNLANNSGLLQNIYKTNAEGANVGDIIRMKTTNDFDHADTQSYIGIFVQSAGSHTHSAPNHTHTMGYEIKPETLSSPSVIVTAGEKGSETSVGTYTTDQTNIDITSNVSGLGTGVWANVKFDPNKRMRIEGNVYVKLFIESKT